MESIRSEALGRMVNVATILPLIKVYHKLNCHTYEKHGTGRQWKKEGTRKETRKKERRRKTKKMRKKRWVRRGRKREEDLRIPNIYGNFTLEPVIPM